jgi:hypothetical protein
MRWQLRNFASCLSFRQYLAVWLSTQGGVETRCNVAVQVGQVLISRLIGMWLWGGRSGIPHSDIRKHAQFSTSFIFHHQHRIPGSFVNGDWTESASRCSNVRRNLITQTLRVCHEHGISHAISGYHTLASECKFHSGPSAGGTLPTMSKQEVLSILDHAWGFLTPDQILARLQSRPDRRSMYSYLLRLYRQSLLERKNVRRGTLAYRLTERGRARLLYFQKREEHG